MSTVFDRLSAISPMLVRALLDVSLKGAVILLLTWLATLMMRRASAAARHLVWFLSVAGLLVLPMLAAALPGLNILPSWTAEQPAVAAAPIEWKPPAGIPAPATPSVILPPSDVDLLARNFPAQAERSVAIIPPAIPSPVLNPLPVKPTVHLNWQAWILLASVAGTLMYLAYVLFGWISLHRLQRRSTRINSNEWSQPLLEIQAQFGFLRRVKLISSPKRAMPMTWGIRRTTILLPEDSATWSEEQRRAVLSHELAHAKRMDCLTQLVAQIACAIYWFNPLVWLAWHRMQIERERACDDVVLSTGTRASAYAEQLLKIASELPAVRFSTAAIAMARPSTLEGRLLAILDVKRNRRAMTWSLVMFASLLIAGFSVPLAMVRGQNPRPVQTDAVSTESPSTQPTHKLTTIPADDPWRVTLSNGVTAELVGVSTNPSTDNSWWKPDGTPMPHAPAHYPPSPDAWKVEPVGYEFAISVKNVAFMGEGDQDTLIRMQATPTLSNGTSYMAGNLFESSPPDNNQKVSLMNFIVQSFGSAEKETTIHYGIGGGPWKTLAEDTIDGSDKNSISLRQIGGTNLDVSFANPTTVPADISNNPTPEAVRVTVAHNIPADQQVRIVAVLADGKEVRTGDMPQVSNGHVLQLSPTFFRVAMKDIKSFRLQSRPFQWAQFKNIALAAQAPSTEPVAHAAVESIPGSTQPSAADARPATARAVRTVAYRRYAADDAKSVEKLMVADDGRQRVEEPDGSFVVRDAIQGKQLYVNPVKKTAVLSRTENLLVDDPMFSVADIERLADPGQRVFASLGTTPVVNGEALEFQFLEFQFSAAGLKRLVWRDAATHRPSKIQIDLPADPPIRAATTLVLDNIVFDAPLDQSAFSLQPPAGYQVTNGVVRFKTIVLKEPATRPAGAIDVRLENARQHLNDVEQQYHAGLATVLEYERADWDVKILEAEQIGEPVKAAKVRLDAATAIAKRVDQLYRVGLGTAVDLHDAQGRVKLRQAEWDALQAPEAVISPTTTPPNASSSTAPAAAVESIPLFELTPQADRYVKETGGNVTITFVHNIDPTYCEFMAMAWDAAGNAHGNWSNATVLAGQNEKLLLRVEQGVATSQKTTITFHDLHLKDISHIEVMAGMRVGSNFRISRPTVILDGALPIGAANQITVQSRPGYTLITLSNGMMIEAHGASDTRAANGRITWLRAQGAIIKSPAGVKMLEASLLEYTPALPLAVVQADAAPVDKAAPVEQPSVKLWGQVVDDKTGQPIEHYTLQTGFVDATDPTKVGWGGEISSSKWSDGKFQHDMWISGGEPSWLRVLALGYLPEPVTPEPVKGPPDRKDLIVRMKKAPELKGVVLDSAGKPVAGALVISAGMQGLTLDDGHAGDHYEGAQTTTGADGRFAFAAGPGNRLVVSAPTLDAYMVPGDQMAGEMTIHLPQPASLTIHYDIEGSDDQAAIRAELKTWDLPDWKDAGVNIVHRIKCRQGGVIVLSNLLPGAYDVVRQRSLNVGDYHGGFFCDRSTQVVKAGENTSADFVRKTGQRIRGKVTGLAGTGIPGAIISVRTFGASGDMTDAKQALLPIFDAVTCGADGLFETARLSPGNYTVIAEAYEHDDGGNTTGWQLPALVAHADLVVPENGDPQPAQLVLPLSPRKQSLLPAARAGADKSASASDEILYQDVPPNDPTWAKLLKAREEALLRVSDLKGKGLLTNHPELVAAEQQLEELRLRANEYRSAYIQQHAKIPTSRQALLATPATTQPTTEPAAAIVRHFVQIVIAPDGAMTFQGADTTWDKLPAELEKVPDRANTVLCLGFSSDKVTIGQLNDALSRAGDLAHRFGFEYLSNNGQHAMGSKGGGDPKVQPGDFAQADKVAKAAQNLNDIERMRSMGTRSELDCVRAAGELKVAQAESTGDTVKVGQALLDSANAVLDLVKKMHDAGIASESELHDAQAWVNIRQAELKAEQAAAEAHMNAAQPATQPNSTTGVDPGKTVKSAVDTISTCAEGDPRIAKALESLKGTDQPTAVAETTKFLASDDDNTRRAAIYVLWRGEFKSIDSAIESLTKLCGHKEDLTRGMAALALGANKAAASKAKLIEMATTDKSAYARRCAAYALGLLGDADALPVLRKVAADPDPMVANNAKAAIKMLSGVEEK